MCQVQNGSKFRKASIITRFAKWLNFLFKNFKPFNQNLHQSAESKVTEANWIGFNVTMMMMRFPVTSSDDKVNSDNPWNDNRGGLTRDLHITLSKDTIPTAYSVANMHIVIIPRWTYFKSTSTWNCEFYVIIIGIFQSIQNVSQLEIMNFYVINIGILPSLQK